MKYGITLPNIGFGGNPYVFVDFAVLAENAGWDGVFLGIICCLV